MLDTPQAQNHFLNLTKPENRYVGVMFLCETGKMSQEKLDEEIKNHSDWNSDDIFYLQAALNRAKKLT